MTDQLHLSAALAGVGATVMLGGVPWFRGVPLSARIAPYRGGETPRVQSARAWSGRPLRAVLQPLVVSTVSQIARVLGHTDPVEARLRRAGSATAPATFRLQQGVAALLVAFLTAAGVSILDIPGEVRGIAVVSAPLAMVLITEQELTRRSAGWQQRVLTELPTTAERLGMLLGAGFSLTSAMARLADRPQGECTTEFGRIQHRIGQGLSERAALTESIERVGVDPYRRVLSVLALNREATDLGTLISHEARHVRAAVHRTHLEEIERRGQQVWIPVTVATLLPGVVFLAIPFVDAMSHLTT